MDMVFNCPNADCKGTVIEEGQVARYQCKNCGLQLGANSAQLLVTLRQLPENKRFLIVSTLFKGTDDEDVYWSNTDGWVDKMNADMFTTEEKLEGKIASHLLPVDGEWQEIEVEE